MFTSIKVASRAPKTPAAHVCFVWSGAKSLHADDRDLDKKHQGVLTAAIKRPEFNGSTGDIAVHSDHKGMRLIVVGLGDQKKCISTTVRQAAAKLLKSLNAMGVKSVSISINASVCKQIDSKTFGRSFGEGMGLASFTFDEFKKLTAKKNGKVGRESLSVSTNDSAVSKAMAYGLRLAESSNFARTVGATPPNIATPDYIAKAAQKIARGSGGSITCKIIRGKALETNKLVGLINVGKASEASPCLIEMTYTPPKRSAAKKTIMLVGKTITYDTGGLSLKVNNGMKGMKYDKLGGMAVLGAMHAVSWMKPKCKIVAYLPAAENSISDEAYRPDDIIEFLNGVTVEVTNTDAEGRLVLADALAYGCKKVKPDAIIDLATLTGGVVVALGKPCAGLWCDDDKLRPLIEQAGEDSGDRVWRMPLFDDYKDMMKAKHADIWNSAPVRHAHPIQGAAFLSYFVDENIPWAHIDIAGTGNVESPKPPIMVGGPTGFGVRLLAYYLECIK